MVASWPFVRACLQLAMASPSRQELEESLGAVSAALADARARRSRAKAKVAAKARQQVAATARAWVLPEAVRRPVVIMCHLADSNAEAAVNYLGACGRQRHWPQKTVDELSELAHDVYNSTELDEINALSDGAAPLDPQAYAVAAKRVHEWRVRTWARDLNVARGVAPSSGEMLQRAEEVRLTFPEASRPAARGTVREVAGRKWVERLRLRWGGRYAAIRAREPVSQEEMWAKVVADAFG